MERYYKIADLIVKMNPSGILEKRAEKYLCDNCDTFDFQLESSWQRLKNKHPNLDDDMGEYISTGFNFYKELLRYDGIMLHSSAVVVDGKAYLFTADSGVGKSTHTQLWLKHLGERAYILNDDKPAIRLINSIWYAYGTPWSGKNDISQNIGVPIGGIAILNRAAANKIIPFSGPEAISLLMKQLNRPKAKTDCEAFLFLLDKLLTIVPVWKLECNKELEAAVIASKAMLAN